VALATTLYPLATPARIVVMWTVERVARVVEIVGVDSPAARLGNVTQRGTHALTFGVKLCPDLNPLERCAFEVDVSLTHGTPFGGARRVDPVAVGTTVCSDDAPPVRIR
jgi:hypothetical protein